MHARIYLGLTTTTAPNCYVSCTSLYAYAHSYIYINILSIHTYLYTLTHIHSSIAANTAVTHWYNYTYTRIYVFRRNYHYCCHAHSFRHLTLGNFIFRCPLYYERVYTPFFIFWNYHCCCHAHSFSHLIAGNSIFWHPLYHGVIMVLPHSH